MIILVSIMSTACSDSSDNTSQTDKAGFYEIEPISFSFQNYGPTLSYTSSRIRISYSFFQADESPGIKPLFVFFNGGPGCATCTGLLSLNTAPFTLDKNRVGNENIKANPYSFTRLGNLLYIDAPNTGFSYNLTDNAHDKDVRTAEFDARNFNPFIDASQVIRVLLRFLADHPAIQGNSVVIVGESYGGTRATAMLNMLLFYNRYGDGSRIYKDDLLSAEIQNHFESINPSYKGLHVPPIAVAAQFGSQVLIEPLITGYHQDDLAGQAYERDDSVIFSIASITGTTYTPCDGRTDCNAFNNALDFVGNTAQREIYQYDKSSGYIDDITNNNHNLLDKKSVLSIILDRNISSMSLLKPLSRYDAYRYIENSTQDARTIMESPGFKRLPAAEKLRLENKTRLAAQEEGLAVPEAVGDTLEKVLGILNPWDAYIVDCNEAANSAYYNNQAIKAGYPIDPFAETYGRLFFENLALVRTFITDCELDLVIYAAVLPDSLKEFPDIVENVIWENETDDGYIDVYYRPGAISDIQTPYMRSIYFPRYSESGHMVTLAQPDKFFEDVRNWLPQ
jgi:hypothetical protein